MFKDLLDFIINLIGGQEYINIFIALVSAAAAGIIAFATWKYTKYSRKNYEELKRQNEFLLKKEREDYFLSVRQESIELLQEIRMNGSILFKALERIDKDLAFLETHDTDDLVNDILKNPTEYGATAFLESFLDYNNYKTLLNRKIKYKNPNIIILIKKVYGYMDMIALNVSYIYKEKSIKDLRSLLESYKNIINEVLADIKRIYGLFKEEGIIDFENSEYF